MCYNNVYEPGFRGRPRFFNFNRFCSAKHKVIQFKLYLIFFFFRYAQENCSFGINFFIYSIKLVYIMFLLYNYSEFIFYRSPWAEVILGAGPYRCRLWYQNGWQTVSYVTKLYNFSNILIRYNKMQQYAGVYLLQNYSISSGCLPHPSSGVHQIVTAASGTGHSVRATTSASVA